MAAVDTELALPDGSDPSELEYKGYVGELLKLIGRRALERTRRRVHEAPSSGSSRPVEVLQGEEGRGSDRHASEARLHELKSLMYADACAREEQKRIEEELQEVEIRLAELSTR
eukprot:6455899-Amphidinium_carterae.1